MWTTADKEKENKAAGSAASKKLFSLKQCYALGNKQTRNWLVAKVHVDNFPCFLYPINMIELIRSVQTGIGMMTKESRRWVSVIFYFFSRSISRLDSVLGCWSSTFSVTCTRSCPGRLSIIYFLQDCSVESTEFFHFCFSFLLFQLHVLRIIFLFFFFLSLFFFRFARAYVSIQTT
jgi:hypothetical protein